MTAKFKLKIGIDILMILGLLFLSGFQFWGDRAHEWVGAGMFVLFILHHMLNLNWYKNLFRGTYTWLRGVQTLIDLLLFDAMAAQMYSGIILSRYVFDFLPIEGGMALARRLHILGAYWGFLLMSLHLGMHWNMILGMLRKWMGQRRASKGGRMIAAILGCGIVVYGVWVLVKRDFITYLFLRSEFVFMDYGEPLAVFYGDYLAVMGLGVFVAYYGGKMLKGLQIW